MTEAPEPGSYARPGDPPPPSHMTPDAWVRFNGERFAFFMDQLTSAQAFRVRKETGERVSYWVADVVETNGTELDSFAVLLWMARLQNGEPNLRFEQVTVSFADDWGLDVVEGEAGAESPE